MTPELNLPQGFGLGCAVFAVLAWRLWRAPEPEPPAVPNYRAQPHDEGEPARLHRPRQWARKVRGDAIRIVGGRAVFEEGPVVTTHYHDGPAPEPVHTGGY